MLAALLLASSSNLSNNNKRVEMDRLFPLNAATIALSGLGVISATLIRHIVRRNNTAKGLELRKDLLFLEAFEVMKVGPCDRHSFLKLPAQTCS